MNKGRKRNLNLKRNQYKVVLLSLVIILIIGGLFWANLKYTQKNPGGNDFLVHWVGTRSLLIDGNSPYSDETALKIQTMVYGRAAQPGEHELRVAYPIYSILIFSPFAFIADFNIARAAWMVLLELSIILMFYLSIKLVNWKPNILIFTSVLIFSFTWYHAVRPLINGNAVLLVGLFLVGGILAVKDQQDEVAGILFALSTIKPQVVILPIILVLFWSLANKRYKIISWFMGVVLLLSIAGALLVPDWMLQNLREILRYPGYNPPGNPASALEQLLPGNGNRVGWIISVLSCLLMVGEWIVSLKKGVRGLIWAFCLTLVLSQWSGIQTDPGNFVVVFPAIILIFSVWDERWKKFGSYLIIGLILGLTIVIWALFVNTVEYTYQPVQSPIMFFPVPSILLLCLYWVRWWAIRPPKVWLENITQT